MPLAIRQALLIGWHQAIPEIIREPLSTLFVVVTFGLLPPVVLRLMGTSQPWANAQVGALVGIVAYLGLTTSIHLPAWHRQTKFQEMVFTTPTHPLSYAIGVALVPLFLALPALALLWGVLLAQGAVDPVFIVMSVPVLALAWFSTVAFGSTLSWRLKLATPYRLEYLAALLALLLVFLPPVYYPATNLGSFAWLSYLAPTSNAASLLLASAHMDGGTSVVLHGLALLGWTSLGVGVFTRSVHWQET